MPSAFASELTSPPEDPRLYDQELRPGVDCWTVRESAVCRVDQQVVWEEGEIAAIENTQGDAIWAAFLTALRWNSEGVALRHQGTGGTWHGSDGEREVWLRVQLEEESPDA